MADRVTKVTLTAQVGQYVSGMQKAEAATRSTTNEGKRLAQQQKDFDALGRASLALGALTAAGVALAVSKYAEYDKAMSAVQAATHASATEMSALRGAAVEAGRDTAFSAAEAANAIEELSKAGVSTANVLGGGLKGSLDLAAAGEIAVGDAAETAASAMTQFNLAGSEVPHIADLLAAGAGKAQGSVSDMSGALNQSGLVASQMGLSLEETVGSLAAFASAGLMGSDSGTAFRSMLLRLANPTDEAKTRMEELGIAAYNAQGDFVGIESLAGQLQGRLGSLTQAQRNQTLALLFGQDAIRAASILYAEGADGIAEWTANVDDAGYAAETARIRMDNLAGDVEKLGGSFDSALIKSGTAANDVLRSLVQGATGVVDAVGDLPEPVLGAGLAVSSLGGAVALAGGAALLAVPKFAEYRAAADALGISGGKTALAAAGAGVALVGLTAVVGQLAKQHAEAQARAEAYADTLEAGTNKITNGTREMVVQNLQAKQSLNVLGLEIDAIQFDSAADSAERLGLSVSDLADASLGNVEALERVAEVTRLRNRADSEAIKVREQLGLKEGEFASAVDSVVNSVRGESASLDEAIRLAKQKQEATTEGVEVTKTSAEAYLEAAGSVDELTGSLEQLVAKVLEANGLGQDAVSANLAFKNALAEVDEQIRSGAVGMDQNTEAGRGNLSMLNDLAGKSQEAAQSQFELDGNTQNYRATLEAGRQALIDRATQLGMNADEAGALADQIYRIPSETEWEVIAETAAAQAELDRFIYSNNGKTITLQAAVAGTRSSVTSGTGMGGFKDGGMIPHLSGGSPAWWRDGVVQGPGGPREDRVAAMLSPGEFVVNADSTRRNLALLHYINGSGRAGVDSRYMTPAFGAPGASGGGAPIVNNNSTTNITMTPVRDNDPYVTATVLGREISRRSAG